MTKKAIDYSKTVIYKIVCNDPNITDCYVGHTTNFRKRKCQHKENCNTPSSKKHHYYVYKFIRDNGGWINWSMIEIEKHPCQDSQEACKRERYWLEELKATLNKQVPGRTNQEYKEQHKNLVLMIEKKSREKHKEKLKEKYKEYYIKNKEIISEKHKSKRFTCECGSNIRWQDKSTHYKSKKHIEYLSSLQ